MSLIGSTSSIRSQSGKPVRVGSSVCHALALSELTPTIYAAYGLATFDGELAPIMDLAFTRGGLADVKVFGVDARKAYLAFEQAYQAAGGGVLSGLLEGRRRL